MGNTPSSDPVPAIVEAEASGDTAALFADIRATLRVPVVNLIWRHLATIPGALPWTWATLKPLHDAGTLAAEAEAMNAGLKVPSEIVAPGALSGEVLTAIGLSPTDIDQIDMILRSYGRSNTINIISVCVLSACLGSPAQREISLRVDQNSRVGHRPPIGGAMPRLMSPDEMAPDTRTLIDALNDIGGRRAILPTMYRHLAHWPGYLKLVHDTLAPCDRDGRLEGLIIGILADSRSRAAPLGAAISEPSHTLEASERDTVATALTAFAEGPLCKMIAIVAILNAAASPAQI
ncbi:MAG: hypothetical protein JXQ99_07650 [Hyphomicrobiaceae bacterium]